MEPAEYALISILVPYIVSGIVLLLGYLRVKWSIIAWIGSLSIGLSSIASFLALAYLHGEEYNRVVYRWVPGLHVDFALRVDMLSAIVGLVVAVLSFLIGLYSIEYIGSWGAVRYWFLYTFFVASMLLLVYADNLVPLFIGWEGTGLSSWGLISFYYDEREEAWVGDPGRTRLGIPMWFTPTHSGLRALGFTRVGDMGMIVGMGVIYALLGTTSITELLENSTHLITQLGDITAIWIILFYLGALAKSAQFPFHEWLVTAMTGPTSVSALIHAATMVKAGVFFALRFTPAIALGAVAVKGLGLNVFEAFTWLSLLTAFATATMAIVARELKLILAYSTASQLSYMLAAIFAAAAAGEPALGTLGGLSHLVSHAVFKAALFLAAGAAIHAVHSRFITDMGQLRRLMPLTFASMLLAGLSLSAIPPFSGWWSKDIVVHAINMISANAALIALFTAFLTAAYTARMIYYVFLWPHKPHGHPHEPGKLMLYPYLVLGIASLALGIFWPNIEYYIAEAATIHEFEQIKFIVIGGTVVGFAGFSIIGVYIVNPRVFAFVEKSTVLIAIRDFLYDRWLLNPVIYRIIVLPSYAFSKSLYVFEQLFDRLVHMGTAWIGQIAMRISGVTELAYDDSLHIKLVRVASSWSSFIRSLQSGDIRSYITYLISGVILVVIITYIVVG